MRRGHRWLAAKRNGAFHVVPGTENDTIRQPHIYSAKCVCQPNIECGGALPIIIHYQRRCTNRARNLEELDAMEQIA